MKRIPYYRSFSKKAKQRRKQYVMAHTKNFVIAKPLFLHLMKVNNYSMQKLTKILLKKAGFCLSKSIIKTMVTLKQERCLGFKQVQV